MHTVQAPATSDDFDTRKLGLQWQWHANPLDEWVSFSARPGWLSLTAMPLPDGAKNLWAAPNLLLQKLPARTFTATTFVDVSRFLEGERTGLLMMGSDYSYLAITRTANNLRVVRATCIDAPKGTTEKEEGAVDLGVKSIYLRVTVGENASCQFSYSLDGKRFSSLGNTFSAQPGRWIGAKVGLFSLGSGNNRTRGYADYDWFKFERFPPS